MSNEKNQESALELICITTLFPNKTNERHGIFIYNRLKRLIELHNVKIHVISPFPLRSTSAFRYDLSSEKDSIFESVSRPRFVSIPIINQYLSFIFIALAAAPAAIRIARTNNIKLVDSHFLYPDSVSAGIISRLLKIPLINTARGSDVNYWPSRAIPRYFIKKVMEQARYNFAVSNKLAEKMKSITPIAEVDVLPNGVDTDVFYFSGEKKKPTREVYKFLSVGNLIPLKGHDLVIEAIANVPNTALEVIGHGPEKSNLMEQVKRLKLDNRVSFIGNVSQHELSKKYQSAHALILASEMEGMPNVVLEALSCGLQVICTAVGDIPEILTEDYGWVVNRDKHAIKDAMKDSIVKPKKSSSISDYAKMKFSWEKTIEKYYRALNDFSL